jgi:hypothetical protein
VAQPNLAPGGYRASATGPRPGGGLRGSIYAPTRRKQALRAEWQAAVALRFGGLIDAQLRAAMGTVAAVAKMDGTWAHIPAPMRPS